MDTSNLEASKLAGELERQNPEAFQELLELMRGMIAARSEKTQN
jgi:hypothetical protein